MSSGRCRTAAGVATPARLPHATPTRLPGLPAGGRLFVMRCAVTVNREGGSVVARCREFPGCEGRAATTSEALARLRQAVVFWLEACPCNQTADSGLVFDVVEDAGGRGP